MTALLASDDVRAGINPTDRAKNSGCSSATADDAAAEPDPADLTLDDLAERIVGLAGRLAAQTCRWLLLVAHFDAREGYARIGLGSTARWLSHCCGLSHRTAVEHVRVARALVAHPQLAEAMSSGRLSFSHVRAISRLVCDRRTAPDSTAAGLRHPESAASESAPDAPAPDTTQPKAKQPDVDESEPTTPDDAGQRRVGPVTADGATADVAEVGLPSAGAGAGAAERAAAERAVADLIEVAEAGTVSQLETVVRGLRTVEIAEASDGEDSEYLRQSWTATSQWGLTARLDAERGAVVQNALDRLADAEGFTRVDALVRMAELALVMLNDAERRPRELRGDERAAIVVHLDATAAATATAATTASAAAESASVQEDPVQEESARTDGRSNPAARSAERLPGPARLMDGPGLSASVVRQLMCAGRIRTALHDESGVLNLGRSRRTVSRRQYRALLLRDGCCKHPGCGSRSSLEAHHVQHWIDGGRTDMANLLLLCRRHHHRHHDGEFTIEAGPGRTFTFRRTDGRELACHIDPSTFGDAAARAGVPGLVGAETPGAVPGLDAAERAARRWAGGGERLNRPWAISVLAQRRSAVCATDGAPPTLG